MGYLCDGSLPHQSSQSRHLLWLGNSYNLVDYKRVCTNAHHRGMGHSDSD